MTYSRSRSERRDAWWRQPKGSVHEDLHQHALDCIDRGGRRATLRLLRALYISSGEYRSTWRVTKNAVESVKAKISKARPRPWIVTVDGSRTLRERAKTLTEWSEGQFERVRAYELGTKALHDALIYGSGALKAFEGLDGKPCIERVWVGDLGVEAREENQGAVKTLYQVARVDREVLMSAYSKHKGDIEDSADAFESEITATHDDHTDQVAVIEAWRLPMGKVKGRHVICTDKVTLLDEEWEDEQFPIEFIHWTRDPESFFGCGLVESMAPIQQELDDLAAKVNECYDRISPKMLVAEGSEFTVEQMSGSPWECLIYKGTPPEFATPPAISNDFLGRERQLIDGVYQLHGISQLSAQAQKPAGLNSGKALAVHSDIESERFMVQAKEYEDLYVRIARQLIRVAEEIAEREGADSESLTVLGGKKALKALSYAEARFGDDPMAIRAYPVSALSSTPAGKLRDVQDLMQAGIIQDPEEGRELLDFPDLNKYQKTRSASRRLVDKQIEACLKGNPQIPNTYSDLGYALKHATLELQLAEFDLDEDDGELMEGMEMLRDYIAQVETLLAPPEPPPAPAAPPAPGPGSVPPGPPAGPGVPIPPAPPMAA